MIYAPKSQRCLDGMDFAPESALIVLFVLLATVQVCDSQLDLDGCTEAAPGPESNSRGPFNIVASTGGCLQGPSGVLRVSYCSGVSAQVFELKADSLWSDGNCLTRDDHGFGMRQPQQATDCTTVRLMGDSIVTELGCFSSDRTGRVTFSDCIDLAWDHSSQLWDLQPALRPPWCQAAVAAVRDNSPPEVALDALQSSIHDPCTQLLGVAEIAMHCQVSNPLLRP